MPESKGYRAGGVDVRSPIWLAPLAGITTRTFRDFHRELGAGLVHTEMVSAVGLSYKNKKTGNMIGDDDEPRPVVLQLFAPDADSLMRGAELAYKMRRFDALEINMACPMPKVTKRCGGASLLNHPEEASRMVSSLKLLGSPVWVKLRITDKRVHPLSTENFCEEMLSAGADLLILHGRTPAQRYEGSADKAAVCEMSAKFPGVLAASGDCFTPEDAMKYLDAGCVAALAARGVMKDAFVIPKILHALGVDVDEKLWNPSPAYQIGALIEAGRAASSREGGPFARIMAQRMLSGLLKGLPGASALRSSCSTCRDWPSLEKILTEFRA
ncbi:MAG: tRNA-dihydrouridine synthase family protein [Synergistaceae bacterium]|jgi:tRNA-dihydrouridine synthase B|nr:tRNA-dihydrouridine synthase family protein [Synergistaceae bacterium]